jgi:hypothetical protein
MALPQPTYTQYRPQSFLDEAGGGVLTKALELYAKYHPAAMQQRVYAAILEDEQFAAKSRQEQRDILAREREALTKTLANFRETGLGPSGRGGGAAGGARAAGRGGGAGMGSLVEYAGDQAKKLTDSKEQSIDESNRVELQYQPAPVHDKFIQLAERRIAEAPGKYLTVTQLGGMLANEAREMGPSFLTEVQSEKQKRAAATRLWNVITRYNRNLVDIRQMPDGTFKQTTTDAGMMLAQLIDEQFRTSFLVDNLVAGQSPTAALQVAKNTELRRAGAPPGKSLAEQRVDEMLDTFGADGVVTEDEQAKISEMRKLYGLAEPLDEQEQAFLVRYIEALRDDGVATREELGADYDAARAAYEKGRNLEQLPRGMAAFYDESYLRGLGRLSQIDEEMAALRVDGTPAQIAARRAYAGSGVGIPTVTPEAVQRAAAVHPIAGEVLPYAMKRVMAADGTIEARTPAERFAQRYINMDTNRDFAGLVEAVNKRFPNNPVAKREALAFYGAANYQADTAGTTMSRGAINANPGQAAAEKTLFMEEVAPTSTPTSPAVPVVETVVPPSTRQSVPVPPSVVDPYAVPDYDTRADAAVSLAP